MSLIFILFVVYEWEKWAKIRSNHTNKMEYNGDVDQTFRPVRLMTRAEKDEMARRADNLYQRPNSDDWEFWDMIAELDRLRDDCDRR
jgi:hypothetical protein